MSLEDWRSAALIARVSRRRATCRRGMAILTSAGSSRAAVDRHADRDDRGQWVKQGMTRGDERRMPKLRVRRRRLATGEADLVIEMPAGFEVRATDRTSSGTSSSRRGSLKTNGCVASSRPGARKVVHHAIFAHVPGGSLAALDGADGRPGFGGMGTVGVINGSGQSDSQGLGGWAVGATPRMLPDGIAARLPRDRTFCSRCTIIKRQARDRVAHRDLLR